MKNSLEEQWETVSINPDPAADLGYVHEPLTVIHVKQDGEHYLFLPGEEDHLSESEFLIASPSSVCRLRDQC